jgi:hypothetical protein
MSPTKRRVSHREATVTTVKLHLDNQTFERVKDIADRRRATVEGLIQDLVERLVTTQTDEDPFLGMFAQEPDLVDAIVASAMHTRETGSLRLETDLPVG